MHVFLIYTFSSIRRICLQPAKIYLKWKSSLENEINLKFPVRGEKTLESHSFQSFASRNLFPAGFYLSNKNLFLFRFPPGRKFRRSTADADADVEAAAATQWVLQIRKGPDVR